MYLDRIITKEEKEKFGKSLKDHQKKLMLLEILPY